MSSHRISVVIVKSTPKAHLIADAADPTRQGWVVARWVRPDLTVAAATFEKAVAAAAERAASAARKRDFEAAERGFANTDHAVRVAKETDLAVAAEVVILAPGGSEVTQLVWFPKSAIGGADGIALIPGWMIRDRETRACEGFRPAGYYERHRMCKGERASLLRGVKIEEPIAI